MVPNQKPSKKDAKQYSRTQITIFIKLKTKIFSSFIVHQEINSMCTSKKYGYHGGAKFHLWISAHFPAEMKNHFTGTGTILKKIAKQNL